jgi:hypothetical protein
VRVGPRIIARRYTYGLAAPCRPSGGADARDMATRIDRLHQERHAEAEKHRQEMDSLRATLEDARRPWWRRLTGW